MRSYDKFVKVAYEEIMGFDKEAAARWKKEFGNLPSRVKDKLRKEYMNPEKYIKGLEKGNVNLMAKYDIPVVNRVSRKDAKEWVKKQFPHERALDKTQNHLTRAQQYFMVRGGAVTIPDFKERTTISGFDGNGQLNGRARRQISKKYLSKLDKRGLSAMTLRHEIDEAREKASTNGAQYYSHYSPRVLHRESANVTSMPKRVRKVYDNLRGNRSGYLLQGLKSEKSNLKNVGGIKYGKSPYYDKKKANAHVKKNAERPAAPMYY